MHGEARRANMSIHRTICLIAWVDESIADGP
jgi:hypothetical protein